MVMGIYDKLALLVDEREKTNSKVYLKKYDLKCNNKVVYTFDYEMNLEEESMLDFIYNADNLGFGPEVGILMEQKINLEAQKSFFTKLFIYERLSELEKNYEFSYTEYVPQLNTGEYDKEPKNASQLLDLYGSKCLKTDKEFKRVIKSFKNMEIISDSDKSDDRNIIKKHK